MTDQPRRPLLARRPLPPAPDFTRREQIAVSAVESALDQLLDFLVEDGATAEQARGACAVALAEHLGRTLGRLAVEADLLGARGGLMHEAVLEAETAVEEAMARTLRQLAARAGGRGHEATARAIARRATAVAAPRLDPGALRARPPEGEA